MDFFVVLCIGGSLAIIAWSLDFHGRRLIVLKEAAGRPGSRWSESYSPRLPANLARWAIVAAYLAWCVVRIAESPGKSGGYLSVLLLAIFLSFAPRRSVYLGPRGIVRRMRYSAWRDLKEMKVVERGGARYLVTDAWRLRLPKNVALPGRPVDSRSR